MFSHCLVLITTLDVLIWTLNSIFSSKDAKPVRSGAVRVVMQPVDSLVLKTTSLLNKLHDIAQQTAGEKIPPSRAKTTAALLSATTPETCWPRRPLTTMANHSLIQHHAKLTGSPRLWGGSGAAAPAQRKREMSLLQGSREANGQKESRSSRATVRSDRRPSGCKLLGHWRWGWLV